MIRNLAIALLIVGAIAAAYGALMFDWTLVIIGVAAGVFGVVASVAGALQAPRQPRERANRIR